MNRAYVFFYEDLDIAVDHLRYLSNLNILLRQEKKVIGSTEFLVCFDGYIIIHKEISYVKKDFNNTN